MSESWSFERIVRRLAVMRAVTVTLAATFAAAACLLSQWVLRLGPGDTITQLHVLAHVAQIGCTALLIALLIESELVIAPAFSHFQRERQNMAQAAADREAALQAARDARARLAESETLFRSSFDSAATGMALYTTDGKFLQVNRSLCELLGYTEAELQRLDILALTHADDVLGAATRLQAIADGDVGPFSFETRYLAKGGRVVIAMATVGVVLDQEAHPRYCISQVEDITARRRVEENNARLHAELRNQAQCDDLTGLSNRRGFRTHAERICAAQRRSSQPLMLVAIDLDYLKAINDTWGHEAGDQAILLLATALQGSFRSSDVIARVGGDEFLCLLPNAGDDDVTQIRFRIASRLARLLEDLPQEFPLSATVGVAVAPPRSEVILDSLMREADRALYDGKRGRPTRDAVGVRLS